jgi:hypothetical protein
VKKFIPPAGGEGPLHVKRVLGTPAERNSPPGVSSIVLDLDLQTLVNRENNSPRRRRRSLFWTAGDAVSE